MYRSLLCALMLVMLAAPSAARSRSTAAVDAANAAKAGFSARNGPASSPAPEGAGVANRSLKVVIVAVEADGRLVLADADGAFVGSIDPRAIPRLTAQDKARFGGRKRLDPRDLAAGQYLKLTFRGNTAEVLRAKVLKDRSS